MLLRTCAPRPPQHLLTAPSLTLLPSPTLADNVYVTNLDDQNTIAFVEELQRRLRAAAAAAEGPHAAAAAAAGPSAMFVSQSTANLTGIAGAAGGGVPLSSISAAHEELPFELRALEIALDTVRPASPSEGRQLTALCAGSAPRLACGLDSACCPAAAAADCLPTDCLHRPAVLPGTALPYRCPSTWSA